MLIMLQIAMVISSSWKEWGCIIFIFRERENTKNFPVIAKNKKVEVWLFYAVL